jgi:hypothetical protein
MNNPPSVFFKFMEGFNQGCLDIGTRDVQWISFLIHCTPPDEQKIIKDFLSSMIRPDISEAEAKLIFERSGAQIGMTDYLNFLKLIAKMLNDTSSVIPMSQLIDKKPVI